MPFDIYHSNVLRHNIVFRTLNLSLEKLGHFSNSAQSHIKVEKIFAFFYMYDFCFVKIKCSD